MRELYLASVKALAAGRDTVARIGGDEFAILFPGAPLLAADRPVTVDALVDAADRATYRHKQLTRPARASSA